MKNINETLGVSSISLNALPKENTVLFIVDMVIGFVEEGILSSPRVKNMSNNLLELNENMSGYRKVIFIDSHNEDSEELKSYPRHCLVNSKEEDLIDGLKECINDDEFTKVIKKNSTNGFHVPQFKEWLDNNINTTDNYIITGCVTDICVMQFALTLKTYFNQFDISKRVIIPTNVVETFDIPGHSAEEMNLFALSSMKAAGIEIVSEIN